MNSWLQESDGAVTLALYIQPRASRNEVVGEQGDELKIRLTSPPVEGAANRLCREYFAKLLRVSRSDVELASGERSRHKRLRVRGVTRDQVRRAVDEARG